MILIDTFPLVALMDKGDKDANEKSIKIFRTFNEPVLTTWPCFTEALYFLGGIRGWTSQARLWRFIETGAMILHPPGPDEWKRVRELMAKYHDTPMDFADASLVTLAEVRGIKKIFTKDSDFQVYRIHDKDPFDVIWLDSK